MANIPINLPPTKSLGMNDIQAVEANLKELVSDILAQAKALGASGAQVSANKELGLSTTVRMGTIDTVEFNRDNGIHITVYFGQSKGLASTTDTSREATRQTLQAACDIAKSTAEDPYAGLADSELMAYDYPDLDLYHPWQISTTEAIEYAKACEAIALDEDARIVNSEGASLSSHHGVYVYGNSHCFIGSYPS